MAVLSAAIPDDQTGEEVPDSSTKRGRLTHDDICFKIAPVVGCVSYEYFSIHIMNTAWFKSVFHSNGIVPANSFWFNAHIGIGLYLFGSSHLQHAPINRRILYSVFGSFLFNFGSFLFWGTCRSLLPKRSSLRVLFGLVSGFILLYVGKEYVDYVDKEVQTSTLP